MTSQDWAIFLIFYTVWISVPSIIYGSLLSRFMRKSNAAAIVFIPVGFTILSIIVLTLFYRTLAGG